MAVDVAVFTVQHGRLLLLLIKVRDGPFAGAWALPGGRVSEGEPLDEAARRELAEKTGVRDAYLEQLYTFGDPGRDPAARVVSVAYMALIAHRGRFLDPGAKYAGIAWFPVRRLPALAYDHRTIARVALARLRAKLGYTTIVSSLLPREFTMAELQRVYEIILGRSLDRRNFRRRILALGLLAPVGRQRRGRHRPAALYRFRCRRGATVRIL